MHDQKLSQLSIRNLFNFAPFYKHFELLLLIQLVTPTQTLAVRKINSQTGLLAEWLVILFSNLGKECTIFLQYFLNDL